MTLTVVEGEPAHAKYVEVLEPDQVEADNFLRLLTGKRYPRVTLQTFTDPQAWREAHANAGAPWRKNEKGQWIDPLAAWRHGTLSDCWPWLVRQNRAGAGIFYMVNRGDGGGRSAAHVEALRALFIDDDSGTLTTAALGVAPSIVVQSKHGLHVYWKLREGEPLEMFTPAQEALAKALGTDPAVKDLARVMRVPGFYHLKDPSDPFNGNGYATGADASKRAQAWLLKRDNVGEGGRNQLAFSTACGLRDFGLSEGEALDLMRPWNRGNEPPLEEAELADTVSHAFEYAKGSPGSKEDRPQPEQRNGKPHTAFEVPVGSVPRIAPVRLTVDDIRNPPREQFVIGNRIPLAKPSVLFGPTSVGKTALLAQLAFAFAAAAATLWGLPLLPGGGPVLVYSLEDTFDDWKRKAAAILVAGEIDVAAAIERLWIHQTEGLCRLSEVVTVRSAVESRCEVRSTAEQDRIIDAAREVGARLILFGTASRAVEEEDNAHFSGLQSALGKIARVTGAAVLVDHHATKAATKDNDSAIESARGGGALIANARNALSLFPAEPEVVKAYADRFPAGDIVTLAHGKATSSTRRSPPLNLVRCDATWGAVFRLPDEVTRTPEEDVAHNGRMEQRRQREAELLGRLYDVVASLLRLGPASINRLRDRVTDIGVGKRHLEALVETALERDVLRAVPYPGGRGKALELGTDPRQPDSGTTWDDLTSDNEGSEHV